MGEYSPVVISNPSMQQTSQQISESAEEIFKRVQQVPSVNQLMVFNQDGLSIRSSVDAALSVQYGAHVQMMVRRMQASMKDIDSNTQVQLIRVNSDQHEMVIAPENECIMAAIIK